MVQKGIDTPPSDDEKSEYVINFLLHFSAEELTLERKDTHDIVKLQRPASRCLKLLLDKKGQIISQKEMIAFGWGVDRARYITNNAFYQIMHHLRQSLTQVGFPDLIHTIPRHGTTISGDIIIDGVCTGTVAVSELASSEAIPDSQSLRNRRVSFSLFSLVLISAIIITLFFVSYKKLPRPEVMTSYASYQYKNCKIEFLTKYSDQEKVIAALHDSHIDCIKDNVIFASTTAYGSRVGMLVCPAYKDNESNCHSVVVMEDHL